MSIPPHKEIVSHIKLHEEVADLDIVYIVFLAALS